MPGRSRGRILIDGYNLSLNQGTGIATYTRNLTHQVHALGFEVDLLYGLKGLPGDPLLQEIAFYSQGVLPAAPPPTTFSRVVRVLKTGRRPLQPVPLALPGKVLTDSIADRLPYFDRVVSIDALYEIASTRYAMHGSMQNVRHDRPLDVVHLTYPMAVKVANACNICTIHDLVPLRLPYTTTGHKARQLGLLRKLARELDHIVTVSESSRRDIIELLDVPENKVTNTYQCVELPTAYVQKTDGDIQNEVEGIYGLPYKKYFLFYSALEPKKNLGRLIEAYCSSGVDAPLVIVGKLGWLYDADLRLVDMVNKASSSGRSRIIRLEYVPQSMLVSLIRGARGVLFPSLYEGFGLAVLEAMLLGVPVLTSTVSSLPEIAGDAGLLVDPYDIRAIANGIKVLWDDTTLCETLVAKGYEQSKRFSPEAYRMRLEALYDSLLN